jgi:hypothetical protein
MDERREETDLQPRVAGIPYRRVSDGLAVIRVRSLLSS